MTGKDWADDPGWREYARHVIDELVPKIAESACTISLVPAGETDVKFAVELGMSIMLDKPILLLVVPGRPVPAHLARVADQVVEFDPQDGAGTARRMYAAMHELGIGEDVELTDDNTPGPDVR